MSYSGKLKEIRRPQPRKNGWQLDSGCEVVVLHGQRNDTPRQGNRTPRQPSTEFGTQHHPSLADNASYRFFYNSNFQRLPIISTD
ncbi:MAG: hypothetical protein ACUVQK_08055 [Thermogutta sp.]